MNYDLDYFIEKFQAIPADQWTTGKYVDGKGCKCAYGHCGVVKGLYDTKESKALFDLEWSYPLSIPNVNDSIDGKHDIFGTTPKQRVVNYLKSLKQKEQNDGTQ